MKGISPDSFGKQAEEKKRVGERCCVTRGERVARDREEREKGERGLVAAGVVVNCMQKTAMIDLSHKAVGRAAEVCCSYSNSPE